MLKTYLATKYVYYNNSAVCYCNYDTIQEESEAIDTETIYSGYDEIQANISKIPCIIGHIPNKKPEKEYLELWNQDTDETYRIFRASNATVKVTVRYSENKPRLKDLANMKADLVFQYMAQFINNERS